MLGGPVIDAVLREPLGRRFCSVSIARHRRDAVAPRHLGELGDDIRRRERRPPLANGIDNEPLALAMPVR
jgi:hypothetical protein